ncbi:hypothetical protein KP509_12G054300 [Ceratopteris richardii]|uniref:AAA+ ATPase domain-containing protein n=1 Tax=Ceratopteris richardii TaxID=49495 RepID=A0A8T2TLW9_CERRI|nr:hypothetical protein KP509_12G054300 [Ceratopteris richardii]
MEALPLHASCFYGGSRTLARGSFPAMSLGVVRRGGGIYLRKLPFSISCTSSDPSKKKGNQEQLVRRAIPSIGSGGRGPRKKPFRLRARWRLVVRRLRRLSPSLVLHNLVAYARTQSKRVALSTILGFTFAMGCLFLKLTAIPTPHFVPYSELVNHLHTGSVTSVLFEEGSRQVFFNMKPAKNEDAPIQTVGLETFSVTDVLPSNKVGKSTEVHERKFSEPSSSSEDLQTRLQTELSTLEASMDEDVMKHWILQVSKLTNIPESSLLDMVKSEEGFHGIRKHINSLGSGVGSSMPDLRRNSELPKDDNVDREDRTTSLTSTAISALSSLLKAVAGAPEQVLKAQPHPWGYVTRRIENDEAYLLSLMREKGVTYSSSPQPMSVALRTTLVTILSLWIPLTPLFWLMHRQFTGGTSTNQKRRTNNPSTNFDDVAGIDEAKVELMEVVSYLQGAANFRNLGAKLPKGILLVGPPGTGKTLLARAVAGEAGVPFFAASASEFVEMFVGRGAARIRELFSVARKTSPSIIFIDELDAVGGRRGRSFNDERDQTLNQLLTEMDGFESETGVLVIAATNRPEALDPALCRPGRFSRKVFVKEPDLRGREQILSIHMRGVPVEGDFEAVIKMVASITGGFVGADLANVVNEAALLAAREGRPMVTVDDLRMAVTRGKFGVGNRPAFSSALGRIADWVQPKAMKPLLGYEAPTWSG